MVTRNVFINNIYMFNTSGGYNNDKVTCMSLSCHQTGSYWNYFSGLSRPSEAFVGHVISLLTLFTNSRHSVLNRYKSNRHNSGRSKMMRPSCVFNEPNTICFVHILFGNFLLKLFYIANHSETGLHRNHLNIL